MSGVPYGRKRGALKPRANATARLAPPELLDTYKAPPPSEQLEPISQPFEGSIAPPQPRPTVPKRIMITAAPKLPQVPQQPPAEYSTRIPYVAEGKRRQAISQLEATNPLLKQYEDTQRTHEEGNPYMTETSIYVPPTRKSFYRFIEDNYRATFGLPLKPVDAEIDQEACAKLGAAGNDRVEAFLYQKFIREYIRQATPYRGVLVYHGLGTGKTCSAIAAAESLYGIANKRIIVMTPFSLRPNFLNEITFCGFRHFQLKNHWVAQPLENVIIRLYAKTVLSLNDTFVASIMKRTPERQVIWIPDFTKPSNYQELDGQSQSDIRAQILQTIESRITFINYNGITANKLKEYACTRDEKGNTIFDNSVIIIDEVHNLTRLMQGSIIPYMVARAGKKRRVPPEPVAPGKWAPKLCGSALNYKRSFLFYRLLCGAKNSKIIGLSGTPIINFPEELGILANILAGYIDTVQTVLTTTDHTILDNFVAIANADPRTDIVRVEPGKGMYTVLISVFQEGYEKVLEEDGTMVGVRYSAEPSAQLEIKDVYARIKAAAQAKAIPVSPTETYTSYARLPPDDETFRGNFIDASSLAVKNEVVLKKRLTGIISYYKGSKEEYMPRIIRDDIVPCGMSDYVLGKYTEARKREIEGEARKKEGDTGDVFADVEFFARKKNPSSYRFRSRAICNFAFPKSITRPFPEDEKQINEEVKDNEDAEIAEAQTTPDEDRAAEAAVALEDASIPSPEEGEEEAKGAAEAAADALSEGAEAVVDAVAAAATLRTKSYQDLVKEAMQQLDSQRDIYLKLDGETPDASLRYYSPKLSEILTRIEASKGSNLVYSQFKTVEGLGVLSLAMKANGYKEIQILGSDAEPFFSPETEASLRKGPGAERRFISFTGEGSKERRGLILNVFNGNFDKLPGAMKNIFIESGYGEVKNRHGEICWVIGITGAGAEGISLKCVRGVHIMEPYWNMVRLDQVKGRAIRICSHADLPFEERDVEIYTYYTSFAREQVEGNKVDFQILTTDGPETSDQKVLNVSMRKQKINEELLTIMKEVSVDCFLNAPDNEPLQCFDVDGMTNQYMFDPDLEVDKIITTSETKQQKASVSEGVVESTGRPIRRVEEERFEIIQIGETGKYIMKPKAGVPNTFELFALEDSRLRKPVGTISINPITGAFMKPVMFS